MPQFFIDRPVFAWVVALFILLAGALAIPQLPVAKYPDVAPPQVEVYAIYPGASAQTLDESVVSLIEQELNGTDGLLYFESQSSLAVPALPQHSNPAPTRKWRRSMCRTGLKRSSRACHRRLFSKACKSKKSPRAF